MAVTLTASDGEEEGVVANQGETFFGESRDVGLRGARQPLVHFRLLTP